MTKKKEGKKDRRFIVSTIPKWIIDKMAEDFFRTNEQLRKLLK